MNKLGKLEIPEEVGNTRKKKNKRGPSLKREIEDLGETPKFSSTKCGKVFNSIRNDRKKIVTGTHRFERNTNERASRKILGQDTSRSKGSPKDCIKNGGEAEERSET